VSPLRPLLSATSGSRIPEWSGHREGEDPVARGNRLVGPETLDATLAVFANDADRELAERLLLALEAGESTGANTKGALSDAKGAFVPLLRAAQTRRPYTPS